MGPKLAADMCAGEREKERERKRERQRQRKRERGLSENVAIVDHSVMPSSLKARRVEFCLVCANF